MEEKKALYKIRRSNKGRPMLRWLTESQVMYYRQKYPYYKFVRAYSSVENTGKPDDGYNWVKAWGSRSELYENRLRLRDTSKPKISIDDILDMAKALGEQEAENRGKLK